MRDGDENRPVRQEGLRGRFQSSRMLSDRSGGAADHVCLGVEIARERAPLSRARCKRSRALTETTRTVTEITRTAAEMVRALTEVVRGSGGRVLHACGCVLLRCEPFLQRYPRGQVAFMSMLHPCG